MSCVLGLWPMSLNMVQRLTSTETARTARYLPRSKNFHQAKYVPHAEYCIYIYTHIQLSSNICMGIYDIYIWYYIYIYTSICMFKERERIFGRASRSLDSCCTTNCIQCMQCTQRMHWTQCIRCRSPPRVSKTREHTTTIHVLSFHRDTGGARASHVCLLRPDNKTRT